MVAPVVVIKDVSKNFVDGKETHRVLDGVNLCLHRGESLALTGASGSGKSTLLNIIAGFEPMTSGELKLSGKPTNKWRDKQWGHYRHSQLGVVFQQFNLLTPLNVRQNIEFPLSLNKQQ